MKNLVVSRLTWPILLAALVISLLLVSAGTVLAGGAVTVGIKPLDGSGVSGLGKVSATEGDGATVDLVVTGLTPGTSYQARLQAGSCDTPSASFALLGTLQPDAEGKATLSTTSAAVGGRSMDLTLAGLADGDHVIRVLGSGTEACGFIPALTPPAVQSGYQFKSGFQVLASYIPTIVGQPLEDEHYAANGDSLQQTTTGLMVWRKADNWTAFTDGNMTWVNGPEGIQVRPNSERFDWEN